MSYAIRNSLILGSLALLVILAGGYWVWWARADQLDALQAHEDGLQSELAAINEVMATYDATQERRDALQERWESKRQVVPAHDNPAQTLSYCHAFLSEHARSVTYDFLFHGREDHPTYSVNRYALSGDGRFEDVYAFVCFLEKGRHFYSVDHLEITYTEPDRHTPGWLWVAFKLLIRAYFEPKSRVGRLDDATPNALDTRVHNPFRPLITKTLPKNKKRLFETDGAHLKGLAHNLAYLIDKNGQSHVLKSGDPVFLGRMSQIELAHSRVVFELNKGGIYERRVLNLQEE